jgi:hypothetical protein
VIKGEPNAPAMVVKRDWKRERDYQKKGNHQLIIRADYGHGHKVSQQDHQLGRNNIDQNCPNEESLLAFEVDLTRVASVLNLKRPFND